MDCATINGTGSRTSAAMVFALRSSGAGGIVSRLEDKMAWQSVRHDPVSALAKTDQAVAQRIITLRRQRLTGQHIAIQTGVSSATVSRVLKRFRQRLNCLKRSREWACSRAYPSSQSRKEHLPYWTHMYNWHRPHSSLKSKIPISRLSFYGDNLLKLHI